MLNLQPSVAEKKGNFIRPNAPLPLQQKKSKDTFRCLVTNINK